MSPVLSDSTKPSQTSVGNWRSFARASTCLPQQRRPHEDPLSSRKCLCLCFLQSKPRKLGLHSLLQIALKALKSKANVWFSCPAPWPQPSFCGRVHTWWMAPRVCSQCQARSRHPVGAECCMWRPKVISNVSNVSFIFTALLHVSMDHLCWSSHRRHLC